jgi:hypothetical protein
LKRTPITRKKTKRLSKFDAEFERMKPFVHARSGGKCEMKNFLDNVILQVGVIEFIDLLILDEMVRGCTRRATQVHHRKYRRRGGTNHIDNLADICTPCHNWIHAHGGFGGPANLLRLALSAGEDESL